MLTVMIIDQNQDIVLKHYPKTKFTKETTNTSTFRMSEKKYKDLVSKTTAEGYNRFALFYVC